MDTTSLPPDDRPPVARPRRANRGLLWAAALAVVVLAIATAVAFTAGDGSDDVTRLDPNASGGEDSALVGTDVTGSQLPALSYETFGGAEVPLVPDGRPLLVNFWSSTCAPCVREMPALEQAYQANGQRIDFLGVQVAERAESGATMIQRTGVTYPTGRDPRGDVFEAFGGVALPRTAIVRTDGTVAWVHNGELSESEIQAAVDDVLAGS